MLWFFFFFLNVYISFVRFQYVQLQATVGYQSNNYSATTVNSNSSEGEWSDVIGGWMNFRLTLVINDGSAVAYYAVI